MNVMRAWIRIALSPPILRRALATCAVVGVILTLANQGAEVFDGRLRPDHVWPIAFTFIVPFVVAMISSAAAIRPDFGRHEAPSADELEAVVTFPDSNPNPVLRVVTSDVLLYANPASTPLLRALGANVGAALPLDLATRLRSAADPAAPRVVQIEAGGHTYLLKAVAISDLGFINVYGTELTELEGVKAAAA
jgi:hypothetical protein